MYFRVPRDTQRSFYLTPLSLHSPPAIVTHLHPPTTTPDPPPQSLRAAIDRVVVFYIQRHKGKLCRLMHVGVVLQPRGPYRQSITACPGPALRPPLKKSLFPVQRVAEIMAGRAAAKKKSVFLSFFGKKIVKIILKKKKFG